jgi:CBS domain-containing protein
VALEQPRLREFVSRSLSTLELAEPTLVSPNEPLERVIALMRERGDSCALIAQDGVLRGIVTERDVLCRFMDSAVDWGQPVERVMTPDPVTLDRSDPIVSAIRLMREHDFRTVPIVEGSSVRGLVRLGDLIRNLAELFPEEILNLPPRPDQQMKSPEGA